MRAPNMKFIFYSALLVSHTYIRTSVDCLRHAKIFSLYLFKFSILLSFSLSLYIIFLLFLHFRLYYTMNLLSVVSIIVEIVVIQSYMLVYIHTYVYICICTEISKHNFLFSFFGQCILGFDCLTNCRLKAESIKEFIVSWKIFTN